MIKLRDNIELSDPSNKQTVGDNTIGDADTSNIQCVNYETAVSMVGFGKYNYYLLCICIPTTIAMLFASSTMSYILSQAQCDLSLSLENKGMLNAITYIGIISSGLMWGILADKYGRRIIISSALALDATCNIIASFSRTYWLLLLAKYFSGFMICAPLALQLTYLAEFHNYEFRPKLITIIGVYAGIAKILLPLLAWMLLPLQLHVVVIPDFIELKSWHLYIFVCSIPSVIGSIVHFTLPESPKFLMAQGRYKEAMDVFTKIYLINKSGKSLPFSRLIDDTYEANKQMINTNNNETKHKKFKLFEAWQGIKPLLVPPFVSKVFLAACINFGALLGSLTLRLWLPQMLATMDEYSQLHPNANDTSLCEMLDYSPAKQIHTFENGTTTCVVPKLSNNTYLYNIIVPVCTITLCFIVGLIVNRFGKKNILIILTLSGGVTILNHYFVKSSLSTVILSSTFLAFSSVSTVVLTSVAVELFPTSIRAKAMSIIVIVGRLGPLVGNVSFPFLLYNGCLTPFIFIASFSFLCSFLGCLLPQTEKKPLM